MYSIHASFDRVLTLSRVALINYDKRMLGHKQKLFGHVPGCAGAWLRPVEGNGELVASTVKSVSVWQRFCTVTGGVGG